LKRVLVFGPYPPTPGPEAAATLACVRELLAEGADVTVVSPVPSAAHHHADLGTPAGAARLLRWARGADALVLCGEARPSGPPRGRREALARRLVEVALRRAGSVTEHRGVVEQPVAPSMPAVSGGGSWQLGPAPSRDELQAEIQRRAATSATRDAEVGRPTAVLGPLRRLEPLGPAPAHSAKPGMGLIKRVMLRLTGFVVNPIIEHVNLLHRATLEALEDQPDGTRSS
jgi:hypothetical protein